MLLLLEWPVTTTVTIEQEEQVKSREEIMNMLEAFDLTGSLRGEWREGTSPSRSLRTVRDSLPSYGSHSPAWG